LGGRQSARSAAFLLGAALGLAGTASRGADFIIDPGASLALGSGRLELACANLGVSGTLYGEFGEIALARDVTIQSSGTFVAGSSQLELAGTWHRMGYFDPGTGSVRLVDGCGIATAQILGSSGFYSLELASVSGKTWELEAGQTQIVTSLLRLLGVSGSRLRIRSTSDGFESSLDLQGAYSTAWLDVKDSHAVGLPIAYGTGSIDSGNTPGWTLASVPGLAVVGSLLLATTLASLGWRHARRSPGAECGAPGD
jgi:hypothetical protein